MHHTSFLNNLSSHLSIFPPLLPSVSASLSSAPLEAFHLSTISMPGHTSPIRLNSYLPFYIPSSLLFPILPLYLSAQLPLCTLYSQLRPSLPLPPPSPSSCPRLKLNPVGVSLARPRLPTKAQAHRPKKQTLKNKIKYIKTAMGSLLHGQCIFLDTISHFNTLSALLHPVCLCFSPPVCFAPSRPLFLSFSDRLCRSLDSEASLQ